MNINTVSGQYEGKQQIFLRPEIITEKKWSKENEGRRLDIQIRIA